MTGAKPPLKLDLLENGIDFIRSGIETFFLEGDPEPRQHKYAVLHIFAGVLLILKERLRRAHPALIFKKVDALKDENALTVDFDEVLTRLANCADVTIDGSDLVKLRRAQATRNKLEHYAFELDLRATEKLIGQLAEIAYVFLREELNVSLEAHLSDDVWSRIQSLRAIAKKLEEDEQRRWAERAATYRKMSKKDLRRLGEREPYHPKHNPDFAERQYCGSCQEQTIVLRGELGEAICINPECRALSRTGSCSACGSLTSGDGLCSECDARYEYLMSKD